MNLQIHLKQNLKYKKCTNFKNLQNYTLECALDKLFFIQKLLTPAHRWRKCTTKTLDTHDWICKVALSSEVLGREKMMQLMIWISYNRINRFFYIEIYTLSCCRLVYNYTFVIPCFIVLKKKYRDRIYSI